MIWPLSIFFGKPSPQDELRRLEHEKTEVPRRFIRLREQLTAEIQKVQARIAQEKQKKVANLPAIRTLEDKVQEIQKALSELQGHENNELAQINRRIADTQARQQQEQQRRAA